MYYLFKAENGLDLGYDRVDEVETLNVVVAT